ncbi:MAG: YobA family protein [Clostridiales bacterium]|nr:YobA family protein [Clostridiales bacterium]
MKKTLIFLLAALLLALSGCGGGGTDADEVDYVSFTGTVSSVAEHELEVEVTEGSGTIASGSVVALFPDAIELDVDEGDLVQVWYNDEVMTSEPPQVNAVSYEILQEADPADESTAEPEAAASTTVQVLEEPQAEATVTELTPNTAMEVSLSTGTAQVLVSAVDVDGNVSISLSLDDMVVDIGEFGRLGSAYLLGLDDGRSFVLLDADYASDDYVTFLYEITDGSLAEQSRLEDVSLQSATVSAEQLYLRVHVDVLGSYDSYMDYIIDDAGALQATSDFYEIPTDDSDWHLLTVTKELPVTLDGEATTLPVGTQLRLTGTDNQQTAYFVLEDIGETGSITYTRGEGDESYLLYIDGVSEYDYFEMLPYAG